MVMSYVGMLFNLRMFMLEFLLIYLFSLETIKLLYAHIFIKYVYAKSIVIILYFDIKVYL